MKLLLFLIVWVGLGYIIYILRGFEFPYLYTGVGLFYFGYLASNKEFKDE